MNSIPVLYENDEIYIINKPAGLAVQGGEKITHSLDVDFAKQTGRKVFLVHRLDKETSGLMIVAKDSRSAAKWTKLIASKQVRKEYVALCCGNIKPEKGCITENIVQHGMTRKAVTDYLVEKKWHFSSLQSSALDEDSEFSVNFCKIRLVLETGRMHQIRIHLAKQGCPIAGDDQHGDFKLNKKLRKILKVKNLMLCSQKLIIPELKGCNGSGKGIFEIELPDFMNTILETCNA